MARKKMKITVPLIMLVCLLTAAYVSADPLYDAAYEKYPQSEYLIGVGVVEKTGNGYRDRRVAEVLARVEIARQIRVRVQEATVDVACEGPAGRIFGTSLECRNKFIMIIEQSVDEVLRGSKILNHGEEGETVYAVAVLQKGKTGGELDENIQRSVALIKENIERARAGDGTSLKKAQEEYAKVIAYIKEKEIIEGVRNDASELFEEMEKEIMSLSERGIE
jgi:hypothetical protein